MVSRLAIAVALACACGARQPGPKRAPAGDEITLYRDWAVIRQRVQLDVPAAPATLTVEIASGVTADQVLLLDRGGLTITGVHAPTHPAPARSAPAPAEPEEDDDIAIDDPDAEDAPPVTEEEPVPPPAPTVAGAPTELRLDVQAPRAGRYTVVIGYVTDRLPWDVAYAMTTTPRRDRALLRGALAIRNTTGIAIRAAAVRLIDAELGAWRGKTAEQLASALVGGTSSTTPPATPRELGPLALGAGETRVELVRSPARGMRSVLVYDPIGTKLDNPNPTPLRDARLGVETPAPARVTESFEVQREPGATEGLPAGPVRLLERRADGSLVVLGESRLFDAATRAAHVDTIAVGTADDVTGTRERRELTTDDENKRMVEEFVITIDNRRDHAASVLVREHLYRGQNWTLAYPIHDPQITASKEGPQQIALRTTVPPRSQRKILYVVVYTWGP